MTPPAPSVPSAPSPSSPPSPSSAPSALARLHAGEPLLALGVRHSRTTDIARMARAAGYHVVWIDLEHSTIGLDAAAQICGCAADLGLEPWVRVPEQDYGAIGRVLDGGARGVIVPRVETAAEAARWAMATRFPPRGQRSQIAVLPQLGFERLPPAELNRRVDAATTLQLLIETRRGVDAADEIAAVDGVDLLGVGLNDLSADLGCLGGHPLDARLVQACERVVDAARRHGKLAVVGGVRDASLQARLTARGAAPLAMAGMDGELLLGALERRAAEARASLGG